MIAFLRYARGRPKYQLAAYIKIAATAAAMPCLTWTRVDPASKPGKNSGSDPAGINQYKMAMTANPNAKIIAVARMLLALESLCSLKHSSRRLKLSTNTFYIGLPGAM